MPNTTPRGIVSPALPDPYVPVTDLATMANTTAAAIGKVEKGANLFKGTQAERAAALTTSVLGQMWQDTDGERNRWVRGPSTWELISGGDYRTGTSGQRATTAAKFGQIWIDSDGNKLMWRGRSNGSWTRFSGVTVVAAGAWDTISGSTAVRTVVATIPVVLEPTETVMTSAAGVGSGFGVVSQSSVAKNATNTSVAFRHMQFLNVSQQAFAFSWVIMDSAA